MHVFPDNSRVWIYQSDRLFSDSESKDIQTRLDDFTKSWTAHNQQLFARGEVMHNRFIVITVDENRAGASGCSIDKSVHFMEELERDFHSSLFNRMNFAYQSGQEIKTASVEELKRLYQTGNIDDQTLFFNNLVSNRGDFKNQWLTPIGGSKLKRLIA